MEDVSAKALTAADAADWTYRGEGAVNLVLGYSGSSPAFVGKVLRIHKVPRHKRGGGADGTGVGDDDSQLSEQELLLWKDVEGMAEAKTVEDAGRLFALHVMRPLLGDDHVNVGVNIPVSRDFLLAVERNVADLRPEWRVEATMVDSLRDYALLMEDHTFLPHTIASEDICISVEIKPKCGFLPSTEFIEKRNNIKKHVSRFRMHQLLKLNQGKILRLSEYDPLDLFSGAKVNIFQAIKALFATPQNNLRVFLNGSIVYGSLGDILETTDTNEPLYALEESLQPIIKAGHGLRLTAFQELVAEAIFNSGILDVLLEAQKLDKIDVEGAIHAYFNVMSEPCLACRALHDAEAPNPYASLHSLGLEESLKIVQEFLIGTTAKDCSIMIGLRWHKSCSETTGGLNSVILKSTSQIFDYKVSFIDLDLKPLNKMMYYHKLDSEIVNFYTKSVNVENIEKVQG